MTGVFLELLGLVLAATLLLIAAMIYGAHRQKTADDVEIGRLTAELRTAYRAIDDADVRAEQAGAAARYYDAEAERLNRDYGHLYQAYQAKERECVIARTLIEDAQKAIAAPAATPLYADVITGENLVVDTAQPIWEQLGDIPQLDMSMTLGFRLPEAKPPVQTRRQRRDQRKTLGAVA